MAQVTGDLRDPIFSRVALHIFLSIESDFLDAHDQASADDVEVDSSKIEPADK